MEQIRKALCRLHHRADVQFEIRTDPSLVGGFILELEGIRYDKSVRGAMAGLSRYLEEEANGMKANRKRSSPSCGKRSPGTIPAYGGMKWAPCWR